MCEERNSHPQTYPRQCKSYILNVPNPGQEKRSISLFSIKSRALCHSEELTHFQYMRIWLDFEYMIQTPGLKSVVLYHSCLTGSIQKLLELYDRGEQHKGRGKAEQVWAGELDHRRSKSPQGFGWRITIRAIFIWIHQIPAG